jgi:hypothetical protein
VPGAVVAIQTCGDLLGFNPHLHVLIAVIEAPDLLSE